MPTLDIAIWNAKAEAKRSGKEQFVFLGYGEEEAYFFGHKDSLGDHLQIVGKVSATEVPVYTRLP